MNPTDLHEQLDRQGLLADSRGSGTYALAVDAPDYVEPVARRWASISDEPMPEGYAERIAEADEVLYVGASAQVYDRLQDHVVAEVRQATFLSAFPPTHVRGVWPTDGDPFAEEYNRARSLADGSTEAWSDGRLF
jgi:hypothetical protein